jgi:hypothetical protein
MPDSFTRLTLSVWDAGVTTTLTGSAGLTLASIRVSGTLITTATVTLTSVTMATDDALILASGTLAINGGTLRGAIQATAALGLTLTGTVGATTSFVVQGYPVAAVSLTAGSVSLAAADSLMTLLDTVTVSAGVIVSGAGALTIDGYEPALASLLCSHKPESRFVCCSCTINDGVTLSMSVLNGPTASTSWIASRTFPVNEICLLCVRS